MNTDKEPEEVGRQAADRFGQKLATLLPAYAESPPFFKQVGRLLDTMGRAFPEEPRPFLATFEDDDGRSRVCLAYTYDGSEYFMDEFSDLDLDDPRPWVERVLADTKAGSVVEVETPAADVE